MKKIRLLAVLGLVITGLVVTTGVISASEHPEPFLCPIVNEAVLDVAEVDFAIDPPAGTSLLPGNNQAGPNADSNAHNSSGPGDPDAGPGGNPDYSPIWPG